MQIVHSDVRFQHRRTVFRLKPQQPLCILYIPQLCIAVIPQLVCLGIECNSVIRVHMTAAFYVTAAAVMGHVTSTEAAVLCLCFGLTMGAELMNTAVERLCDKTARGYDRMVRDAKDIAAAAVFVCAAACVAVGVCIFLAHGVLAAALRFLAARLWLAMVFLVTVPAAVWFVFFFGRKQ